MAGDVLILDTVVFEDFAIPDSISGGMGQMLGVHKTIGGDRTVDSMGQDPDDLSWSGRLRGPSASDSASVLEALAASGDEVSCSWGPRFYTVVVKNFKFKYMAYFEVTYDISLVVVDSDSGGDLGTLVSGLDDLVALDLSTALALAGSLT